MHHPLFQIQSNNTVQYLNNTVFEKKKNTTKTRSSAKSSCKKGWARLGLPSRVQGRKQALAIVKRTKSAACGPEKEMNPFTEARGGTAPHLVTGGWRSVSWRERNDFHTD